ncbi:MAG: two pore domain potassium channel family protein [Chloroflexi bacterium]|nr:two pore domain potassium channel family protein [Chloroflexota bacterium]
MDHAHLRKITPYLIAITLALSQIGLWGAIVRLPQRHHLPAYLIPVVVWGIVFLVINLVVLAHAGAKLPALAGYLLLTTSNIVANFTFWYWVTGTRTNFSQPLTHLDSLYVALGTLSTVGSGSIVAISEAARRIQTVQMGVDFLFVVFAVGIVVSRFGSARGQ